MGHMLTVLPDVVFEIFSAFKQSSFPLVPEDVLHAHKASKKNFLSLLSEDVSDTGRFNHIP